MTSIVNTMNGIKHINITYCKACGDELITGQRFCDSCSQDLRKRIKFNFGATNVKTTSKKRRR